MSDSTLPPEQWRPLFDKIGVEFGYRPFAAHIGMDHTRLRRLLRGGGTSTDAIRQVADGFRVDPSVVRELRGERGQHVEPFALPDDAGRLNETERNVVRAVVRALLDARDNAHAADLPATDPPASTEGTPDQAHEDQKTFAFDAAHVGAPSGNYVDDALALTSADLSTLSAEDARTYAAMFETAKTSQRALGIAVSEFADAVVAADDERIGRSLDKLELRVSEVLSCYDAIAVHILTRASEAPLQELTPLRPVRNGDHLRLLEALRDQTRDLILPGLPDGHPLEERFRTQLERIETSVALDTAWREAVAQREADLTAREHGAPLRPVAHAPAIPEPYDESPEDSGLVVHMVPPPPGTTPDSLAAQHSDHAPAARQPQGLPTGQEGPDRWPDGQPVYNGDDRANWKSWRRAGEPADWDTYRDGRQDDVELAGGPGAARDLGTEPMGRKIRRDQDKAAETPDEPA